MELTINFLMQNNNNVSAQKVSVSLSKENIQKNKSLNVVLFVTILELLAGL